MPGPDDDPAGIPPADPGAQGLPDAGPTQVDTIPPAYWRAFSLVAFTMNRFIVDHVLRAARLFDDDIEALMLFGMLAHLNVTHIMRPGSTPSDVLDSRGRLHDSQPRLRPVRTSDLAQIIRRPRETVRRKLERLAAAGKVRRLEDGWVLEVSAVDPSMERLTVEGARRFIQAAAVMRSALDDADRLLAAEGRKPDPGA